MEHRWVITCVCPWGEGKKLVCRVGCHGEQLAGLCHSHSQRSTGSKEEGRKSWRELLKEQSYTASAAQHPHTRQTVFLTA